MRAEEREDEAAAPRVSEGSEEEGEAVVRRFLDTCAKEQSHALAYDTAWRDVFALQLRLELVRFVYFWFFHLHHTWLVGRGLFHWFIIPAF